MKTKEERLKIREEKKSSDSYLSWGQLARFYTNIKIPWHLVIPMAFMSLATQQAMTWLVPYTSKIMTGAIAENGFLIGFIGFTILQAVIEAAHELLTDLSGQKLIRNVRFSVWGKMLHLPMSFYDKGDSQSMVSRITQDTTGTFGAISSVISLVTVIYGIAINFRQMYMTYKFLALIMLAGIPVILISSWIVGKMQYKVNYITNSAISALTNFFGERLPNVVNIKINNMEDEEVVAGIKANNDRYKAFVKQEKIFIFIAPISSLSQYINEIILLVVATALVRNGTMQMFQMVNLYNYYLLFMSNAMMLSALWQGLKGAQGTSTTIAKIVDAESEDLQAGENVKKSEEDIQFENVSFSYDGKRTILDNVSFKIPKNKVTAIVGENGCGKSTIIKLIERFNEPATGDIRVGDVKLSNIKLEEWRNAVGYLFQGDQMIKGSIRENITYGIDRECTEDELIEATKLANIYEFIQEREEGFDSQISRFDAKCSGGEMQRLAIARIILKKPQYLIMDEATSGIDTISAHQVLAAIDNLMEDKTVIMVSHDMDMIKKADNIVVLNDGIVEASGSFSEVSEKSKLFQQFLS